eukprot:COSAG01_NODE_19679_length_996_cov_0.858417_1_plen_129_part_00
MAIHGLALLVTHFNASLRAVAAAGDLNNKEEPSGSAFSSSLDQSSRPVLIDPPVLLGTAGGARSERRAFGTLGAARGAEGGGSMGRAAGRGRWRAGRVDDFSRLQFEVPLPSGAAHSHRHVTHAPHCL